jgi:hypothetical protein
VRALTGDPSEVASMKSKGVKPTRMADTALQMLEGVLEMCAESIIRMMPGSESDLSINGAHQRSALGIVLADARVEYTVSGSPAHICGVIERQDEILMVDGVKVTSSSATAALRGDDVVGSVVLLT